MEYKLLAIDVDDTLLSDELVLSSRVKNKIRKAVEANVLVTIATGRMYSSALPYAKQLELGLPLITYNGALIKEAISGEVIDHQPIPVELAQEIGALADREDWHLNLYINDKLYVTKSGPTVEKYEEISGMRATLVEEEITDFLVQSPTKLLIIGSSPAQTEGILTRISDEFGDDLSITQSKSTFVEIMQQDVSKGVALKHLAKKFDIKRNEVIAIGDSLNDLEMIEYAGLGVAVANGADELKERSDYVTESNEEDGVAGVIDKFIL
ncbi:Cof-type HAD-IIB family hydrolase [Sporohalobacter salinus]|uniref:Cof-type HAD-IIB family hydrolase n=1 Tax=Sporohalobacter salinus TaxID=1494606 RepID=UPI00195F25B4|nr:Cof-type HAD-IIB family hydrolase [Sporohalobacter salinus]MBM7624183.1 Cof subfamily protein (haloacid dehalogenase superfamily) [Sporohalobacter salinus]